MNSLRRGDPENTSREDFKLILYIDGASRGNPGEAGAGVWITDGEDESLMKIGRYLGRKTNNEAEYHALLLGLGEAKKLGAKSIHIFTDSELIQRQVTGVYRVKNLNLKVLHQAVIKNLKGFSSFEIESIPREQNREADRLANQAIQREVVKGKGKGGMRRGTDGRSSNIRLNDRGEESPSSTGQGGP